MAATVLCSFTLGGSKWSVKQTDVMKIHNCSEVRDDSGGIGLRLSKHEASLCVGVYGH